MANPRGLCLPSFQGRLETELDAMRIFTAVKENKCASVTRRIDIRRDGICPGTGYVFDTNNTKIKRWTDGVLWSDSYHPGGNVMIYRELELRLSADGDIQRLEKPGGLQKKTYLDQTSGYRLVYYYYSGDLNTYGPLRLHDNKEAEPPIMDAAWCLLRLKRRRFSLPMNKTAKQLKRLYASKRVQLKPSQGVSVLRHS
eukprot:m.204068 g.204068  ORF g.204068 m.204068 type:complete len:198 (-) comp17083_c0_seq2:6878-7471(-)